MSPSDIGVVANIVTILGLPAVAIQLFLSERARSAQELIDSKATILAAFTALSTAPTPDQERTSLINIMSLFESIAALINSDAISLWGRKLWVPYLVEMLDELAANERYKGWIRSVATDPEVFSELKKFRRLRASMFIRDDLVLHALGGP
jgi:hypothetical protein